MTVSYWIAADGTTVALDGTAGVKVLRGAAGLDGPPVSNSIDRRVGADGAVLLQTRRPERVFSLPLIVDLVTVSAADVVALFQGPGTLISDSGRELRSVVYESGLEGIWSVDAGGITGLGHRKFPVEFCALDPWWYGSGVSEDITIAAPTPWDAAIPWDSPIPWDGGSSFAVDVVGDGPAWPYWTLHGEVTTLTVSVDDAGAWIWESALDASSYGTVDHRPGSRSPRLGSELNGVAESTFGLWGLVDESSSLDWGLGPGDTSVIVGATGTGGATSLALWYEPRWLSS